MNKQQPFKNFQQSKEQVAISNNFKNWEHLQDYALQHSGFDFYDQLLNEAAELYASQFRNP